MTIEPFHIHSNRGNSKEVIYLLLLPAIVFVFTLVATYSIIENNTHKELATFIMSDVLGVSYPSP